MHTRIHRDTYTCTYRHALIHTRTDTCTHAYTCMLYFPTDSISEAVGCILWFLTLFDSTTHICAVSLAAPATAPGPSAGVRIRRKPQWGRQCPLSLVSLGNIVWLFWEAMCWVLKEVKASGCSMGNPKGLQPQEEERELGRQKKNTSQKLFKVRERHQFKFPRGSAHPNKKY